MAYVRFRHILLEQCYLVVVDYYSKFPVVKKLSNIQSSAVVAQRKSVFEEHGIPSKLVTDNGPQYSSAAFQEFSRNYGFVHVSSSPLYPQSNGMSERTVQTVKDLLQKCKESGQDPHLAMLCLRSTPLSHDLPSPAELLNGRVYQTNLPAVSKPSLSANGDINVKLQLRQDKQKVQFDKTAQQPLHPLFPEDRVRVLDPATSTWKPGIVQGVASTPRSYLVNTERGARLEEIVVIFVRRESLLSSKVTRSLLIFQLTTLFHMKPKVLPVPLLSQPSPCLQDRPQIPLLCCHFDAPVDKLKLQID